MKKLLLGIVMICLFAATPLQADDWGPWEALQQPAPKQESRGPLQFAVKMFQRYISPVDGPRCPMYPTCSSYALKALNKHGPLIGVFQTVDRLYREGDAEHEHRRPVAKSGYIRFSDPLKENDFWLK